MGKITNNSHKKSSKNANIVGSTGTIETKLTRMCLQISTQCGESIDQVATSQSQNHKSAYRFIAKTVIVNWIVLIMERETGNSYHRRSDQLLIEKME